MRPRRRVSCRIGNWKGFRDGAVVVIAPLRVHAVKKLEEPYIRNGRTGDVFPRVVMFQHMVVALMKRAASPGRGGTGAHRRAGNGINHLEALRDLKMRVRDDRLRNRQSVRVQLRFRLWRNHRESRIRRTVRLQEQRLQPLRRYARSAAQLIADGRAPFSGKILAPFKAGGVVQQEVGVSEIR